MKTNYIKFPVLIVILFFTINISLFSQTTIYSTTGGGPWDSTWTWVNGIVPNAAYNVVINGPVYTSGNGCHNLTINSGGALYNNYYNYTLSVDGDLVNNGTISNYVNSLYLDISGDVTNNGTWNNYMTNLTGESTHNITCQNDNPFSGYQFQNYSTGNMVISTAAYFDGVRVHLNNLDLFVLSNATLKMRAGQLYECNVSGTGETSVIYGENSGGASPPNFISVSFTNLSFQGNIDFWNNCSTHGTVINNGTLRNAYYSYNLMVYDDFVNNGTIQSYINSFTIDLYGNFTNNGTITNNAIDLYSDTDQYITELNGKSFNMTYITSFKPSGKTYFLTDIDFTGCDVNMQNDTIIIQDNGLLKFDGSVLRNAVVYATPSMTGTVRLNMNATSEISNCHVYNPVLINRVKARNNDFYGTVLVADTLENDYYSYSVNIHGDITNNGVIRNYINSFTLNIEGEIINDGLWANSYTNFAGTSDQHISCTNGNYFSGYEVNDNNSSGDVIIDDIAYFYNVHLNFNDHNIILPANTTLKLHDGYLYRCNVTGAGETSVIYGDTTGASSPPSFQNVSFTDLSYQGVIEISSDCSTHGTVKNNGTMRNDFYSYQLNVYDEFINNGTIQNYTYTLTIDLYGNFTNNGTITINAIDLYSSDSQYITELNGHPFNMTYFTSFKPSGKTYFLTDVDFVGCTVNMQNDTIFVENNGKISFAGSILKNTCLLANETDNGNLQIQMTGSSKMYDCNIFNPELLGRVIAGNNTFYGQTIVTDTLENDYYDYTVNISGDITNNGVIRNFIYNLTLNISGDIINNGIYTNGYTNLTGTTDQYVTCQNGHSFANTNFYGNNSAGTTYFTDVRFENSAIDFNNNPCIIGQGSSLRLHNTSLTDCNMTGSDQTSTIACEGSYTSDSPTMYNSNFTDLIFTGDLRFKSNCTLNGLIINNGKMVNDYYSYTVEVYGDLINNDTIGNYVYGLTLNCHSDIVNNGVWQNSATRMTGTSEQYVKVKDNHYITGQLQMVSDISTSPFQWVMNGNQIPSSSTYFSGETSQTLVFTSQIDNLYYGTYYCITGGGNSRNIYIQEDHNNKLDIHVVLEGSFDGNNINTTLNSKGLIPLNQPYSGAPWNYAGTESVTSIPANIVDWVLIELRDAPSAAQAGSGTVVERVAGFLRNDEMLVDLDGVSPVQFNATITNNLYVVVYHRNHLAVMSANPVTLVNGYYYYDFTTSDSQAYLSGQKTVNSTAVMYAGDANADDIIDINDAIDNWYQEVGKSGYLPSDANFDGQSDNKDKNDIWVINVGTSSSVPN